MNTAATRYDDQAVCIRCGASAMDVIEEHRSSATVECAFCGQRHSVPPIVRDSQPEPGEGQPGAFRFKFGRFAGLTLAETDEQPNGRRYLEHQFATSEKLRPIIGPYLRPGEVFESDAVLAD